MAKLRGVILAAGRGVRMGGKQPKSLFEVEGRPLLHYVIAGMEKAGVDDLLVVTGFGSAEVQAYVDERWGGENVSYVFNARHASWGNFHSLRVALDQSPGMDVLTSNSDIVLAPDAYVNVARAHGELVLAVQRRLQHKLTDEDMRVEIRGDAVRAIGKDVRMSRSHAEFAGVSLVRHPAALRYNDVASRLEWSARTHVYYEDVFAQILDAVDARAVEVGPNSYAEIDFPEDAEAAADLIRKHGEAWGIAPTRSA